LWNIAVGRRRKEDAQGFVLIKMGQSGLAAAMGEAYLGAAIDLGRLRLKR
jgi:hypothetical protein